MSRRWARLERRHPASRKLAAPQLNGIPGINFAGYGAWAVGFVAPLFVAADIAAGRWDTIEQRAARCVAAARAQAS